MFAAINTAHVNHPGARAWLAKNRRDGWGVTIETFLAFVGLLINEYG